MDESDARQIGFQQTAMDESDARQIGFQQTARQMENTSLTEENNKQKQKTWTEAFYKTILILF